MKPSPGAQPDLGVTSPVEVDLESPEFFERPEPTLAALRERAPVHFHAPRGAFVLTRYDDVSRALRDPRLSVNRGGAIARCPAPEAREALAKCNEAFGGWMVFSDPPRHTRLRDRVAPSFTPARVRRIRALVETIAEELADEVAAAPGAVDLLPAFAEPLPARVTARLLGIDAGDLPALSAHTDRCFAFFGARPASADTVFAARESLAAMHAFFDRLLERKRSERADDVLGVLAREEAESARLEPGELAGLAMTLVAGAFGTTSHLVGNAVRALLAHPGAWERLVRDSSLASAAVEETLRYDGPAFSVQRNATVDLELGGVRLRAGDRLYCVLHAANHDPAVFPAPERFDLDRPRSTHVALGAGTHFCLGASLTRLEAEVALRVLARRAPDLELAGPTPRAGTIAMRGLAALPVRARRVA